MPACICGSCQLRRATFLLDTLNLELAVSFEIMSASSSPWTSTEKSPCRLLRAAISFRCRTLTFISRPGACGQHVRPFSGTAARQHRVLHPIKGNCFLMQAMSHADR